jgi:hypothetical protein
LEALCHRSCRFLCRDGTGSIGSRSAPGSARAGEFPGDRRPKRPPSESATRGAPARASSPARGLSPRSTSVRAPVQASSSANGGPGDLLGEPTACGRASAGRPPWRASGRLLERRCGPIPESIDIHFNGLHSPTHAPDCCQGPRAERTRGVEVLEMGPTLNPSKIFSFF